MDPWAITAVERARHAEQFASLGPLNGFVNGAQAKGFLMQSGLSPMVLAQIWGLADMNGDGQMDLNEFSIACKLINLKLKGFEIPGVLPPAVLVIPQVGLAMAPMPTMPTMSTMQPMMTHPQQAMHIPVMSMGQQMMPHGMMTSMPMTVMTSMPMHAAPMMHQQMQHQIPVSMPMTVANNVLPPMMISGIGAALEWNISPVTQAKYSAVFQQTDKARSGFLAGGQARNILMQSGLAQQTLAQIWALSDIDNDGKLSVEEFIVSGHLCEVASKGEPMPAALPPNLVPPRYRKNQGGSMSAVASDTASTPGSAQGAGSPSSFEDKRKENFTKGQAELERRRQSLVDQQKKEEDERKKKEKVEAEAREKQRMELERQRLAEWEKQRKDELEAHRKNEQEKLLQLKARHQNLTTDLDTLREKVKTLTTNIGDARTGVADVKTFIDGMRSSRDTKMQDMNSLKTRLKEQNERLLTITQEKAQMEAKNRMNSAKIAEGMDGPELTDFEIKKIEKEKEVTELRETLGTLKEKETEVKDKYQDIKKDIETHKEDLQRIIQTCQALYSSFDDKRREIRAEKAKRIRELTDPDHAWGNESKADAPEEDHAAAAGGGSGVMHYRALYDYEARNEDELSFGAGDVILAQSDQVGEPGWFGGELNGKVGWFPEAYVEILDSAAGAADSGEPAAAAAAPAAAAAAIVGSYAKARALFDWTASQEETVSLAKAEVVEVLNQAEAEWWFIRKDDGTKGFAPSSYLALSSLEPRGSTPVEPPPVESQLETKVSDLYTAVYAYASEESGDLTFEAGDFIVVTKKEAEWWTGRIGERTGVFPFNYVEEHAGAPEALPDTNNVADVTAPVEETHKTPDSNRKSKKKKKDEGKKLGVAKVVAPYEATSKEQLTLTKGQMILIRKKTETGWWQGEIQGDKGKKKQVGWFPASYVKLLESGGAKGEAAAAASGGSGDDSGTVWLKALFDYAGQHEDELSFEEGIMIKLVSKEEDVWWKGELDGKVGVFPSNYVEEVVPA